MVVDALELSPPSQLHVTPVHQKGAPVTHTQPSNRPIRTKQEGAAQADDSDTDPEAPIAKQMLSYVLDDPDFDSECSDTPKIDTVEHLSPFLS